MSDITNTEKLQLLKKVAIFRETEDEVLSALVDVLNAKKVRKGAMVVRKGEPGDRMFIIAKGKFRIHDGAHVLSRMVDGEVFGEYSLIDDNTRSASVTAEEEGFLLELEKSDFYRLAARNPRILRGVLKVLIRRIRDMNALEEKLSKSYLKIQKQKEQIEKQSESISLQKEQLAMHNFDLSKTNEEKNHLLSVVIHQIKNPLTSSLCMVEMMEAEKELLDEKHAEGLGIIRKSLKRINDMVNEILDVNAIDSKVFEVKMEPLDLAEILHELIENYRYFIDQKGIDLQADIDSVSARLNRVYFTQIIDNLLSNAVKFTPGGRRVHLVLKESKDKIRFSIRDEGPGLDKGLIAKASTIYQRQTGMKNQELPPTGLGLAIVHRYTAMMEGKVNIESEPGKGTTITVDFRK